MFRASLAAITLCAALAITPASTQESKPPAVDVEASLVGLPVYSSDGQKLGDVTSAEVRGGQTAIRAEMGSFLGLGPSIVLIDSGLFQKKGDRIELTLTAATVKESVLKQNPK